MPIEITVRHDKTNEGGRLYAEKRAEHLQEKLKQVDNVRVILDRQRHLFEAEFIVEQKGHILAEAKEHAATLTAAIDTSVARVIKQIQKAKGKHDKAVVHQQKHV